MENKNDSSENTNSIMTENSKQESEDPSENKKRKRKWEKVAFRRVRSQRNEMLKANARNIIPKAVVRRVYHYINKFDIMNLNVKQCSEGAFNALHDNLEEHTISMMRDANDLAKRIGRRKRLEAGDIEMAEKLRRVNLMY